MFLSNSSNWDVALINIMLMIIWHLTILIICMSLPRSFFEPNKRLYVTRKWEKNGNLYIKNFKIKNQHIFLNGKKIKGIHDSAEYIFFQVSVILCGCISV